MVREGVGRLIAIGLAKTRYASIPADVAGDDRFPIKIGDRILVRIEDDSVIIKAVEK